MMAALLYGTPSLWHPIARSGYMPLLGQLSSMAEAVWPRQWGSFTVQLSPQTLNPKS